jgi:glycosyltransferase involved in cell wall biosynthesis
MQVTLFRVLEQEKWVSMGVYADRLIRGLRLIAPDGVILEPFAPSGVWLPFDIPIARLSGRRGSTRILALYFNRSVIYPLLAQRRQGDINHVLDNSYGHLVHFLDPCRTVVTSHGGTPITWRRWNPEGPAMRFFDWAFAGMLKAARIIAVSEHAKREIVEHYDYDPARIHVVHHGVEEHFRVLPQEKRAAVRARFLKLDDEALLLHVGHTAARKNVETLLRAVAVLRRRGLAVRLLRVGSSLTPAQETLLDQLGIRSWVTQVPPQPNTALAPFYNAADVFVFPSFYEGFGIPLIEAMACGTPVVCSDWELFHEVCGDAALFADPHRPEALADAIAHVLTDAALGEVLREKGLRRARQFTWERTAQETLAVYQEVAG